MSGPTAFTLFIKAKHYLGSGTIQLGVNKFYLGLFRASAATVLNTASHISTYASIPGEISARGGYVAGGRLINPNTGIWTTGASAKAQRFSMTAAGLVFTASVSSLNNIQYAVVKNSAGKALAWCALSSSQFTITSPNTLSIFTDPVNGFFSLT